MHKAKQIVLCALAGCATMGAIWLGVAQEQKKTEALAGFNTPSFNSAASISNGLPEPAGDSFALDQQIFERNHQAKAMTTRKQGWVPSITQPPA